MTESTETNEYNSRSHTILIIKIEKYYSNEEIEQNVITQGMLYLIDLAESEKIKPYIKVEQAKKINNNISVLGNCILFSYFLPYFDIPIFIPSFPNSLVTSYLPGPEVFFSFSLIFTVLFGLIIFLFLLS